MTRQQLINLIKEAMHEQPGDDDQSGSDLLPEDIPGRLASLNDKQQAVLRGFRASGDLAAFFSLLDAQTLSDESNFDSYEYFMSFDGFENLIPGVSMLKEFDFVEYDVLVRTLFAEKGIVLFVKIDDSLSTAAHNELIDKIYDNKMSALDNPALLSIYSLRARNPVVVTGRKGPFSTIGPDQEEFEQIIKKLAKYSNKQPIEIERKILEYVREYSDYNPNYHVELRTY